jgi:Tfp pilus assembly protein PilF
MGRYDQATAAYERAVEHDPSDVKALVNLGGLYERVGAADRAARAYRAALAAEPRLSAVRERLVRLEAADRSIDSGAGTSSPAEP